MTVSEIQSEPGAVASGTGAHAEAMNRYRSLMAGGLASPNDMRNALAVLEDERPAGTPVSEFQPEPGAGVRINCELRDVSVLRHFLAAWSRTGVRYPEQVAIVRRGYRGAEFIVELDGYAASLATDSEDLAGTAIDLAPLLAAALNQRGGEAPAFVEHRRAL